jgi:hypothetical protein
MPVYELEWHTGKGPQIFAPERGFVAPDLCILDGEQGFLWVEAKHKTVFSWHRSTSRWVTGIDLHHYRDYLAVRDRYGWSLWLLFLHESKTPSAEDRKYNCPPECPVGLFGAEINTLRHCENHTHPNWGKHGMVYWARDNLKLLADGPAILDQEPH